MVATMWHNRIEYRIDGDVQTPQANMNHLQLLSSKPQTAHVPSITPIAFPTALLETAPKYWKMQLRHEYSTEQYWQYPLKWQLYWQIIIPQGYLPWTPTDAHYVRVYCHVVFQVQMSDNKQKGPKIIWDNLANFLTSWDWLSETREQTGVLWNIHQWFTGYLTISASHDFSAKIFYEDSAWESEFLTTTMTFNIYNISSTTNIRAANDADWVESETDLDILPTWFIAVLTRDTDCGEIRDRRACNSPDALLESASSVPSDNWVLL